MADLTEKQKRFCREYLRDLNASKAAIRSGYSKKTAGVQGHELLQNPEIQKRITRAIEARATRTDISIDKVVQELARVAFSDIQDFVNWNKEGVAIRDSKELNEDQSRAVSEIAEGIDGKNRRRVKVKLHDKVKALELLGKHLQMFVERQERSGPGGEPIQHNVARVVIKHRDNGRDG